MQILGRFLLSLTTVFVLILGTVACQKETIKTETLIKDANPNANPHAGPIDGVGGCSGPDRRCLESFRRQIIEFPEFKTLTKTMLLNLAKTLPEVAGELYSIATVRTWYLVPVDLNKIPAINMGMHFSADQNALQTFREVWIDERAYNLMSDQDRTTLITHELVMGMKILSNLSGFDRCIALSYQFDLVGKEIEARDARGECRKLYPKIPGLEPAPKFSLTETDYINIRQFTSELLDQNGLIDGETWADWLERNNLRRP